MSSEECRELAAAIPDDQRRSRLEGDLNAHVEGMLSICADWHMLRYALMTGDLDYCERELPGAEERAATTIAGLEVVIAGRGAVGSDGRALAAPSRATSGHHSTARH